MSLKRSGTIVIVVFVIVFSLRVEPSSNYILNDLLIIFLLWSFDVFPFAAWL